MPARDRADSGALTPDGWTWWRTVAVDDDGTVRVWNHLEQSYTLCHDLTEAEIEHCRAIAAVDRVRP